MGRDNNKAGFLGINLTYHPKKWDIHRGRVLVYRGCLDSGRSGQGHQMKPGIQDTDSEDTRHSE